MGGDVLEYPFFVKDKLSTEQRGLKQVVELARELVILARKVFAKVNGERKRRGLNMLK